MAAWGTVFSAFTLKLEIIHRPGRWHSNVDPLSRLPRDPPQQVSPTDTSGPTLQPNNDLGEVQEKAMRETPAKQIEALWTMTNAFTASKDKLKSKDVEAGGVVDEKIKEEPQSHSHKTQVISDQDMD